MPLSSPSARSPSHRRTVIYRSYRRSEAPAMDKRSCAGKSSKAAHRYVMPLLTA